MRIVLDTNVVLSALLWRGVPYHLLQTIRAYDTVELFGSPVLLQALNEVLSRPLLTKRLALIGQSARHVLAT